MSAFSESQMSRQVESPSHSSRHRLFEDDRNSSFNACSDQDLGQYLLGKEIGRGAFGVVYRTRLISNNMTVAVKQIRIEGMESKQLKAVENEIRMMSQLRHRNIIGYLGVNAKQDYLNIFLEYINGGSLRKMLEKLGPLSEAHTAYNTIQILDGLNYLHGRGIAHRDIKGANVLVCRDGTLKLADFGASKHLDHESVCGGLKGTPLWMAPEVIRGEQSSNGWLKADVWSVGCTVVEMITGLMPWPDISNPMTALYRIGNGDKPPLDRTVSIECRDFIDCCCSPDPVDRRTVSQLLHHSFLSLAHKHVHVPMLYLSSESDGDIDKIYDDYEDVNDSCLEVLVGGLPEGMEMLSTYSSDNDSDAEENATTVSTEYSPYLQNDTPKGGSFFKDRHSRRSNSGRNASTETRCRFDPALTNSGVKGALAEVGPECWGSVGGKTKRNPNFRASQKIELSIDANDANDIPVSELSKFYTPSPSTVSHRSSNYNTDIPTPESRLQYFPSHRNHEVPGSSLVNGIYENEQRGRIRAPFSSTALLSRRNHRGTGLYMGQTGLRRRESLTDGMRPGNQEIPNTTTADKLITRRFFAPSSAYAVTPPDSGSNSISPLGRVSNHRNSLVTRAALFNAGSAVLEANNAVSKKSSNGSYANAVDVIQAARDEKKLFNKVDRVKDLGFASPKNSNLLANQSYYSPILGNRTKSAGLQNSPRLPPIGTPPGTEAGTVYMSIRKTSSAPTNQIKARTPKFGPRRSLLTRLEPIEVSELGKSPISTTVEKTFKRIDHRDE